MRITDRRHYANVVLEHIKDGLNNMLGDDPFYENSKLDYISIQSYQNGRENGYSLCGSVFDGNGYNRFWIAFAENRNSDDIVIYFADYDPCQGLGSESGGDIIYKNRLFFNGAGKFEEAAKYILSAIKAMKEGKKITTENFADFRCMAGKCNG